MSLLRKAERCADIVVDGGGTVRNIARTSTRPFIATAQSEQRSWRWICRSLSGGESSDECKANVVDTVWFKDGKPAAWYYTTFRRVVAKKFLSNTNVREMKKRFTEIADLLDTDKVAIVCIKGEHRVLTRSEFEDFYMSRNFDSVDYVSSFVPSRGSAKESSHNYANYAHEYTIKRNGQPQHISYKLNAPTGFDDSRNHATLSRGRTRSAATHINEKFSKIVTEVVRFIEKRKKCRIVRFEGLFVLDADGSTWLVHTTDVRVVPHAARERTSKRQQKWARPRNGDRAIQPVDDDETKFLQSAKTAPGRMDSVALGLHRNTLNSMDETFRRGRVVGKRKKPKASLSFSERHGRRSRPRASDLGSSQDTGRCPGDFCNLDLETQAAVLRDPRAESDTLSTMESVSRRLRQGNNHKSTEWMGEHLSERRSSAPAGVHRVMFSAIAQARAEPRLIRVLLERQARGEDGEYLRDEFDSELSASLGRTLPAHYYREVRVCDCCHRMYTKIRTLRSSAMDKIGQRLRDKHVKRREEASKRARHRHPKSVRSVLSRSMMSLPRRLGGGLSALSTPGVGGGHALRDTVDSIKKTDLAELRALRHPPVAVQMVVSALTVLLFGEPMSWTDARKRMANGERFLMLIVGAMDHEQITPDILNALEPFLRMPSFTPAKVRPINICAARFCAFVRAVSRSAAQAMGRSDLLLVLDSKYADDDNEADAPSKKDEAEDAAVHDKVDPDRKDANVVVESKQPRVRRLRKARSAAKRSSTRRRRAAASERKSADAATGSVHTKMSSKSVTSSQTHASRTQGHRIELSSSLLCEGRDGRPVVSRFMQTMEPTRVAFGRGESLQTPNIPSDKESREARRPESSEDARRAKSRRNLAQRKYTEKLHDPYSLASKNGPTGMRQFRCSDGSSVVYHVLGKPDANLSRTCFVVINDFFETYETSQILFRQITASEIGTQVLLLNLPGQAYTSLPLIKSGRPGSKRGRTDKGTVLNNVYLASRLHELLQGLERSGDFFSATRPFHLVGFGNGGNVASLFTSRFGHKADLYSVRSLVLLNSFANVDSQLAAAIHSTESVFQCLPPDRPELPVNFFSRFLFSDAYLESVGKDMAMNLLTAVANPISIAGRLLILKGAMHHVDLTNELNSMLRIPLVVVHSTENALVPASNVDLLTDGRPTDQIYAHQHEDSKTKIGATAAKLLESVLDDDPRIDARDARSAKALVLWLKGGHQVSLEAKRKITDLFRALASFTETRCKTNMETDVPDTTTQTETVDPRSIAREIPSSEIISPSQATKNYEASRKEHEREKALDAALQADGDLYKTDPIDVHEEKSKLSKSTTDEEKKTTAVGTTTPSDELNRRIEEKMRAYETEREMRAESLKRTFESQTSTIQESTRARRAEWDREDSARLDRLDEDIRARKIERQEADRERASRIANYERPKENNGNERVPVALSSSKTEAASSTDRIDNENVEDDRSEMAAASSNQMTVLDRLEKESELKEAAAKNESTKAAEEEERRRREFDQSLKEMRDAEKERQLDIARADALEEQELRDEVVVHIQKIVRGIFGRRRAAMIREEKEMEEVYAISALRMTSVARMFLAKLKVRNIKQQRERLCAATIIAEDLQRIFRGGVGRKVAQKMRRDRSSANIQRIARGFIGRRRFRREKKRDARRRREIAAAIKMQSVFRMHKGLVVYQQRLLEDIATTTIQKVYRGVLGRRRAKRKREWQKTEPGPERLKMGMEMVQRSRERFEEHRQEIDKLHREQERTEARVSLIHAGLRESEKELKTLERELREIDQLDRDLKELTHEKELFDLEIRKDGAPMSSNDASDFDDRTSSSNEANGARAADAYALEMAIHLKRGERERKKKELEAEFAGVFAEVEAKRGELDRLQLAIEDMEMTRKRKDREFQRLQRNLMELLEEQKEELDNIRAKGVELEVATATSAAAAAATAKSAKLHEEKSRAIFEGTEELLKFQFMSMSLNYFNSLKMMKSLRDMNADTTSAAIRSSADTALAAAAAAAAANIPSMKQLNLGANDIVKAMEKKREIDRAGVLKEIEDAEEAKSRPYPDNVYEWTCADVKRWLDMLMLGQYKKSFNEAAVDGSFLMELTPSDMRDVLGIEHRLHIKKIITMREKLKPLTTEELRIRNELKAEESAERARVGELPTNSTPTVAEVFKHARNGRRQRVELALNKGFDVNTEDGNGNHLLIVAAQQVNVKLCELLIKQGARVNHQNSHGNTALHYAMAYDLSGDLGEFLIENGSDDMIENQWGLSPYDGITEEDAS